MRMKKFILGLLICGICEGVFGFRFKKPVDVPFDKYYVAGWGNDHIKYIGGGTQAQLVLDQKSGAGFHSKESYLYGYFSIKLKLIAGDSAGLVTTFYLSSKSETAANDNHDEIDFEFLGNRTGQPNILQTNVFAAGIGGREQRTTLWFDPSKQYHTYSILWSINSIVFFVDNVPIRIFKNSPDLGVKYPAGQAMKVYSSLWNGELWATRGGLDKVDWSKAPFVASYSSFAIEACLASTPQQAKACSTPWKHWWNHQYYKDLDAWQYRRLRWVHNKQTGYNYCRTTTLPRASECDRNKD